VFLCKRNSELQIEICKIALREHLGNVILKINKNSSFYVSGGRKWQ